jgi:hypothetical protein
VSQPYINLFDEAVPEPGTRPVRPKRPPAEARQEPAFVVGAVRYEKIEVAWLGDDGAPRNVSVTAARVRAMVLLGEAIDPTQVTSDRTRKAPHVRGSDTSEAAARQMDRKLVGKRLAVLTEYCRARRDLPSGFSDNELVDWMSRHYGWSVNTPRARRVELATDGWLEDSGERRNGSIVWRPTTKAWRWWGARQAAEAAQQTP